jgi:hypothetical protein
LRLPCIAATISSIAWRSAREAPRARTAEENLTVASTIMLFVRTSEPVAQRAIQQLIDQVVQREPIATAMPDGDGVGWASYELSTERDLRADLSDFERDLLQPDPRSSPISVEVNTRPDLMKEQIAWGLQNGGPPPLERCDGLINITLSGHLVDWDLVQLICDIATEMWDAIVYDEHEGFEADRL